jgi:hypothetical protein
MTAELAPSLADTVPEGWEEIPIFSELAPNVGNWQKEPVCVGDNVTAANAFSRNCACRPPGLRLKTIPAWQ